MRDPEGAVGFMLSESILHLLVEQGVIPKEKALEAIKGVLELVLEKDETSEHSVRERSAVALVETIAKSFALKD
jgi:hypothetical protein